LDSRLRGNDERCSTQELITQLAAELHASEKSRVQVEHFSKRFPA
jgi:hypothetical protein